MANTQEDIILDGSGKLDSYEMREGGDGPAGILGMDGNYEALLSENFKFGPSSWVDKEGKEQKNTWINLGFVIQDPLKTDTDPKEQGKVIYGLFNLEGEVEDGPNKGRQNLATLHDICMVAGRADLAQKLLGKFSLKEILTELTKGGQTRVFFRSRTRTDNKKIVRSEPHYFIKKDRYEASRKSGTNFRVAVKAAGGSGRAATPPNGVTGTGAGSAQDAMEAEV